MRNPSVRLLFVLMPMVFVGFIAMNVYTPSFPALAHHFAVLPGDIQMSLTLFVVFFAGSQFVSGVVSDVAGRRPVVLIGLTIYIIGSLLLVVAPSLAGFYLARAIQGLGAGSATALARVVMGDYFKGDSARKYWSLLSGSAMVVMVCAPFVGGFLQFYGGYLAALWLMLIYGLFVFAVVYLQLPETTVKRVAQTTWHALLPRFRLVPASFFAWALSNGMIFAIPMLMGAILPFVFHHYYDLDARAIGIALLAIASGIVIGQGINFFMTPFVSLRRTVDLGMILIAASAALLFFDNMRSQLPLLHLIGYLFVLEVGIGMVVSNIAMLVFIGASEQTRGLIGGLYGVLRMMVGGILLSVSALFHWATLSVLLMVLFLLVVCILLVYACARRWIAVH